LNDLFNVRTVRLTGAKRRLANGSLRSESTSPRSQADEPVAVGTIENGRIDAGVNKHYFPPASMEPLSEAKDWLGDTEGQLRSKSIRCLALQQG
jgi:hypothetical protein